MRPGQQHSFVRSIVALAAAALFLAWMVTNLGRLVDGQNVLIRFFLPLLFSLLVLVRPKPAWSDRRLRSWVIIFSGVVGVTGVVCGNMFNVRQFEWLGILLVLFACLEWGLPARFSHDIPLALFLFYWIHPLPGSLFGDLQIAMQQMSVSGSEWFLHLFNVRVWADGLVLRTGTNAYEVPVWCSGMRTAVTVFLLGFGLGMLKRLRWGQCIVVAVAALFQALALNILRICAMVTIAPKIGEGAGVDFLHDTAGIIVLAGVLLVYIEIMLLERVKVRRVALSRELNPELLDILTGSPAFWRGLLRHKVPVILVLAVVLFAGGLVYKGRQYHRAMMIRDVVMGLRDTKQLELAQVAAEEVHRLAPGDEEWSLVLVRLLVMQGKCSEALSVLDTVPDRGERRQVEKDILKAYCLMFLDHLDEAAVLVTGLPEHVRRSDPRVAMILAEMGVHTDKPADVAANIVVAADWPPNASRIRALYPYLRFHRKWRAIAGSDLGLSYTDLQQALVAMEAYMNLNRASVVANMALNAVARWPVDPRLLKPLFFLAMKPGHEKWEDGYAVHMARCIREMRDPDALAGLFDGCFQLARPDLAWSVFRRIRELDSSHPSLLVNAVRYGDNWFSFRKQRLGINAASAFETIDLRPFFVVGRTLRSWRELCELVPLGDELCVHDTVTVRKALLASVLDEFRKRSDSNQLSLAMQYEYVSAIEMCKDVDSARRELDRIRRVYPQVVDRNTVVLSEILERRGDWQGVYETLRGYLGRGNPQLTPVLRLCRAQLNLGLGMAGMYTAGEALRLFPDSVQAAAMSATALLMGDSPEEALFVLSKPRSRRQRTIDLLIAEAMRRTERFVEAKSFCRTAVLPPMLVPPDVTQELFLPPAETSTLWHRLSIPSERRFAENAEAKRENLKSATSPFHRQMMDLWLECYEVGCKGDAISPARWAACGRDELEKAMALCQLALLLCRDNRISAARQAVAAAVEQFPHSPVPWRMLISLSGADARVINAARRSCPHDSEIWLAELVTEVRRRASRVHAGEQPVRHMSTASNAVGGVASVPVDDSAEAWAMAEVSHAAASGLFSAGAMTRAGEYLLRSGMTTPAAVAARYAVSHAQGLLPAYVLGTRCAIAERDRAWALACTKKAVDVSLTPSLRLYEKLVELKSNRYAVDSDGDMVQALTRLRREDPGNQLWMQMLGYVRFKRGGWEIVDAIHEMRAALDAGSTNKIAYTIAAEASRLIGNVERAGDILRRGLEQHPADLSLLNNLAYTLACSSSNDVSEAVELAPELLRRGARDTRILDTVAVVYLRAGQLDKAHKVLSGILDNVETGTREWFRVWLHLAEIALRQGNVYEADRILRRMMKSSRGIPDQDILAANRLLDQVIEAGARSRDNQNMGRRQEVD